MTDAPSLLPPNAAPLELAIEQAGAARIAGVDSQTVGALWNPQSCPSQLLAYLAWAWSVDTWRSDWPDATKRAVIAASPEVKRLKGTVAAVKAAVGALGANIKLQEWWQTGGAPYTATATVYAAQLPPELIEDLNSAIAASAPARAHVITVFGAQFPANIGAALLRPVNRAQLFAKLDAEQPTSGSLTAAILRPVLKLCSAVSIAFSDGDGELDGSEPGDVNFVPVGL